MCTIGALCTMALVITTHVLRLTEIERFYRNLYDNEYYVKIRSVLHEILLISSYIYGFDDFCECFGNAVK